MRHRLVASRRSTIETSLNSNSLQVLEGAYVEPTLLPKRSVHGFSLSGAAFYRDPDDEGVVFNRIVGLRDSRGKASRRLSLRR